MINKIYCGDALEVLKGFSNNLIHLTVTSPPYNTGMNYGIDDRKNYKKYLEYMKEVFKEVYRVTIKGGRLAINLPSCILQSTKSKVSYMAIDYILFLREIGWLEREIITWIKSFPTKVGKEWSILPPEHSTSWGSYRSPSFPHLRDSSEFIIVMSKETHKLEGSKDKIDISKEEFIAYSNNCWIFPPEKKYRKYHPAPFPEELPKRLIKLYTYQNNIVLDPFCGTGSTCVVAKKLKRNYVGIDVVPKFVELTKKRLSQEHLF